MKKQGLRKIIASVSLSLCVALSAGIALTGINNDYASASGSITGENYATTVYANNGSASFVKDEKQLKVDNTFTGLKLTGKSGAIFNLGSFDIGSSDWAGTYNATGAPDANNKNQSLLEMVFAPHDDKEFTSSTSGGTGELSNVTFTISQGNKSIDVRFAYYSYTGDVNGHEILITTKTESQSDYASYRSNKDALIIDGTRRGRIIPADATKLGLGSETLWCGSWGTSTTTNAVYYDFNDVALYTSSQYEATAGGLNDSYLLRDYDSTTKKTNSTTDTVTPWSGFEKDASGRCMVSVSAKFGTVNGDNGSSIIVTKIGDITIGETINVTNDNLVANYHIIPQVVVGSNNEIKLPTTAGERTVTITNVYTGEVVKTYQPSEIVDNKITFNPTVAGAYYLELNIGNYYVKTDVVNAVENIFKKDKAPIAQGVVAEGEGASATLGSATSAQGEHSGIVLEGGAGAKFTINDVDVSSLYYNNMNDFASLFSMAIAPRTSTKAYILFDDINGDGKYDYSDLDIDGDGDLDQDEIITDPTGASIDFVPNLDEDITTISNEELEFKNEVIAKIKKYSKNKSTYDKTDVKYVHGEAIQASELNSINIYLTDVEDPNKVITIKLQCANYGDGQTTASTRAQVDAETKQSFNCYRYKQDGKVADQPYVSSTPKNDIFTARSYNTFTLTYDNNKVATYTNPEFVHSATYMGSVDTCTLLRDYNDYRGGAVLFDGFTSGKVNVTIEFGDLFENGHSAMSYLSAYSGVDTSKFLHYNKETEITSTKVVITNFLGLDLSADNLEYSIFDAYYKTIDDVVAFHNEEFALPYNKLVHPYIGEIEATAKYEILDKDGNLVSNEFKGVYGSDIKVTLPKGKYTLRVTDVYNNTFNLPIGVYSRIKFDVGANVNAYVGEDLIIDDSIVDIFDDFDLSLIINDGYELYSVYLNGEQLTLNEIINIDYSKLTGADVIKLRAKVTDYKITYKYADTDAVIKETTFNMDMMKDGVKLEEGPSVTGKRFLGWFENNVKIEDFESIGLRDIVVYAIYGEPQFNVTFDLGDETYVQVVEEGGKALSYIPTKEGFVFDGWVKEDGSAYDFNTTLEADVKLIAKWKELDSVVSESAPQVDSVIEAEDGKISNVNAIQIICYALLGLGVAGIIAVIVIAILKKKASNKGEEVNEEI